MEAWAVFWFCWEYWWCGSAPGCTACEPSGGCSRGCAAGCYGDGGIRWAGWRAWEGCDPGAPWTVCANTEWCWPSPRRRQTAEGSPAGSWWPGGQWVWRSCPGRGGGAWACCGTGWVAAGSPSPPGCLAALAAHCGTGLSVTKHYRCGTGLSVTKHYRCGTGLSVAMHYHCGTGLSVTKHYRCVTGLSVTKHYRCGTGLSVTKHYHCGTGLSVTKCYQC